MIVRVNTGKKVSGATRYNDQKVTNGEATLLHVQNFPSERLALNHDAYRNQVLELYSERNTRISKPGVHFVLACSPQETISDQKLTQIGQEFMEKMGFGEQPYIIYRHNDTAHPHAHIVSVLVDDQGNKVSEDFIKHRCNAARKELEIKYDLVKAEEQNKVLTISSTLPENAIHYGQQETKKAIGNVVQTAMKDYSFSKLEEFGGFVAAYNVQMNVMQGKDGANWNGLTFQLTDGENPLSPAIKASAYSFAPTRKNLENRFRNGGQKKEFNKPGLLKLIGQELKPFEKLSETDFKNTLRGAGIQVVDNGTCFLYIDHKKRAVYSETDLGKPFTRAYLQGQFSPQSQLRPQPAVHEQTPTSLPPVVNGPIPAQPNPAESRRTTAKPTPPNPAAVVGTAPLTEAQKKELGGLVSKHYQAYKTKQAIFFESGLITRFPFDYLVNQLKTEGKSEAAAKQAVSEFERYKQGKLPEIKSKEQSFVAQKAAVYLGLATQLPLAAESRIQFLEKLNYTLEKEPTGTFALVHTEAAEYRYPLSAHDHAKLLAGTGKTVPFTQPFGKATKTVLEAAASGKGFSDVSHYQVPTGQLKAILPQVLFERVSHDLNRNYLGEVNKAGPVAKTGGVEIGAVADWYFQRGLLIREVGGVYRAGFHTTPESSFQPVNERLQTYLSKHGLPADYALQVSKLATPDGRAMVQMAQGVDTRSTHRTDFVQKQYSQQTPAQGGLLATDFLIRLTAKVRAAPEVAQRPSITARPPGGPTKTKEEREKEYEQKKAVQAIIRKDYAAFYIPRYYYESSLLREPENIPITRLVTTLSSPPHNIPRAEAEAAVQDFKTYRLSQLDKVTARDNEHFHKAATGFLSLVSQAPLSHKHRIGMLTACYFRLDRLETGGYELVHLKNESFRLSLSKVQQEALFTTHPSPQHISVPGRELPRHERKLYELLAMGGELSKNSEDKKPITYRTMDAERAMIMLTPQQWQGASADLNQATVNEALREAPVDGVDKLRWLYQRGILIEPIVASPTPKGTKTTMPGEASTTVVPKQTGYRLGYYLTEPDTFTPASKSLDTLLRSSGQTLKTYQANQVALTTERGRAMVRLAAAIDSGNERRIDYAVKAIVFGARELKPYANDPHKLLDALSKTYGPLANEKEVNDYAPTIGQEPTMQEDKTDNLGKALAGMDVSPNEKKKKRKGTQAIPKRKINQ